MKDVILTIVKARVAIKAVDLALAVIERTSPVLFEHAEYHAAVTELVTEGEITELEYLEPDNGYMLHRMIYFAKGTVIVRGINEPRAISNESELVGKGKRNI